MQTPYRVASSTTATSYKSIEVSWPLEGFIYLVHEKAVGNPTLLTF